MPREIGLRLSRLIEGDAHPSTAEGFKTRRPVGLPARTLQCTKVSYFSGFTLVELMVTLAVLAILATIAVPSFLATIERSRVTTMANDLLAAVQLARAEAIRRGMRVTLCKKASGNQCNTSAGPWSQGWLVFMDPSTQGGVQVDNEKDILARGGDVMPSSIRIEGNLQYASYVASGTSKQVNGGGFLAGTIRVCSTSSQLSNDDRARDIVINRVGRAVIERPSNVGSNCPAP